MSHDQDCDTKPQVGLQIKGDIVGDYSEVINENTDGLSVNLKRMEWIYHWGHEHGLLIIVANQKPEHVDTVREQVTVLGDNLRKMYEDKKTQILTELKALGNVLANVSKASDDIFDCMVKVIINLDFGDVRKFFDAFNVDNENLVPVFRRDDIKEKPEVVNAITFYAYNLAAMQMFQRGIAMAMNEVDQEMVTEEYGNQVAKASAWLDSMMKHVNDIIRE